MTGVRKKAAKESRRDGNSFKMKYPEHLRLMPQEDG